ncbi:MAG: hypothetical protein WC761_07075 [Candidatus Paceibacterota bacterium]|jgi:hypothetical protein
MTKNLAIGLLVLLLLVIGGWYFANAPTVPDTGSVSNESDTEVRLVVTEFGTKLQYVSLLSPNRKALIEQYYAPYVAPELIALWSAEGSNALGRKTSSPYPLRIDIVEVRQNSGRYVVEGNVLEVTSTGPAAVYPVTLTLEKRGDQWLIIKVSKGAYSKLPQSQSIVGFWECLPHKDTSGPQTMECAFGIAVAESDGHYGVDTSLMSTSPVDFPVGEKVRITGIVTPVAALSGIQKYDIDGIIRATSIEKL